MSCEGCIYESDKRLWACEDCVNGSRKLRPAPKPLERKPSRWERRWIRWAEKEAKKREKDKPAQETGDRR